MKKRLLSVVLFFGIVLSTFAQVTTSNIRGLVTDDKNETLPGASVVAIHTPTGTKYGGTSNLDGRYNLLNMRVGGPYAVTISYIGFKSEEFNSVAVMLYPISILGIVLLCPCKSM